MRALYAYSADLGPFESLEQIADQADTPWKLMGEAHFHAGAKALALGRRGEAINDFFEAYRSFDGALNFTFHGRMLAEKMTADPNWPEWITLGLDGAAEDASGARKPFGAQGQPE